MKQKKRKKVSNDKFNFDDEYIIGFSNQNTSKGQNAKTKTKVKKKQSNRNEKSENNRRIISNPKIAKVFFIILLFIGAACFLCLSPAFNVQKIYIENNTIIPSETIESLSQIKLYKNIFLVNKSDAIKNIEKNPYIDSVEIARRFPDEIRITVVERSERYSIEISEGKFVIIDGQGYVLTVSGESKGLPILVGVKTELDKLINIEDNQTRLNEEDLRKLDIVSSVVDTAKNYEVYDYISKIDISNAYDIKLYLDGEQKVVYLGACSDINTRIMYMKEIINNEKEKKGEIFINGNLSEDYVYFRESVN